MAERSVPLKLRKQMLLMRAAVERVELAQHVLDVREAATISAIVRNAMPGDRVAQPRVAGLRRGQALSRSSRRRRRCVAARFKFPMLQAATKWGGVVTVGYKLWDAVAAEARRAHLRVRSKSRPMLTSHDAPTRPARVRSAHRGRRDGRRLGLEHRARADDSDGRPMPLRTGPRSPHRRRCRAPHWLEGEFGGMLAIDQPPASSARVARACRTR